MEKYIRLKEYIKDYLPEPIRLRYAENAIKYPFDNIRSFSKEKCVGLLNTKISNSYAFCTGVFDSRFTPEGYTYWRSIGIQYNQPLKD